MGPSDIGRRNIRVISRRASGTSPTERPSILFDAPSGLANGRLERSSMWYGIRPLEGPIAALLTWLRGQQMTTVRVLLCPPGRGSAFRKVRICPADVA